MILSFHPCFEAGRNIICAGRKPGAADLAAIRAADAVILPQGCYESLYRMARSGCANVFPDYRARFDYLGKTGQTRLFRKVRAAHPKTEWYGDVKALTGDSAGGSVGLPETPVGIGYPCVFKFDWGGEGDNVYFISSPESLRVVLQKAVTFERTGQKGFILQEYIPSQNRSLRVVSIGGRMVSYWRVRNAEEPFQASLAKGAVLDHDSDPDLQQKAVASARRFCEKTGINLAGFDFLFSSEGNAIEPLFLEINYFFGRRGLGGSENYYRMLIAKINRWLGSLGLSTGRPVE